MRDKMGAMIRKVAELADAASGVSTCDQAIIAWQNVSNDLAKLAKMAKREADQAIDAQEWIDGADRE